MKQNKGAVLTGILMMVMVMTLIGVPLLSMVVYNYRFRELDNSLIRSEYENEMAMDKIAVIIRNTVVNAINEAKDKATTTVNATAELQKTNFTEIYAKYADKWNNAYNPYATSGDSSALEALIGEEKVKDISGTPDESKINAFKEEYINFQVANELAETNSDDNIEVGQVVDGTGNVSSESVNRAYNNTFSDIYQSYIFDNIEGNIKNEEEYTNIVNYKCTWEDDGCLNLSPNEESTKEDSYLNIKVIPSEWSGQKINIEVTTRYKKSEPIPPTTLSATFVIDTPSFESVASVSQESIPLSNALLSQGGLIVGGKLTVGEGTTLKTSSNITALGGIGDIAIELAKNSTLTSEVAPYDISSARIATDKDIALRGGSTLTTGTNPIYYKNLYIGKTSNQENDSLAGTGKITVNFNGDVVAEDDLEINYDGDVGVSQLNTANYYGFNDTNNNGPDSSSAIVVNSDVTDKTLSLGNLYLAGRAFVSDVKLPDEVNSDEGLKDKSRYYKSGESIAVKGNYSAYQTPLFDDVATEWYLPYKILFAVYFLDRYESGFERQLSEVRLADSFNVVPEVSMEGLSNEEIKSNFDSQYKWKYFCKYAEKFPDNLKKLNIKSDVIYIEGAGFNKNAEDIINIIESNQGVSQNVTFRDNLAVEYEKYTKQFGYRPVYTEEDDIPEGKEVGDVNTDKAKTEIFGENGWVNSFSDSSISQDISNGKYHQIYKNTGDYELELGNATFNKGIIVCKGDVNISVSDGGTANFSGIIIAGGDVNITSGTVVLEDGKDETINIVIGNYLGTNASEEGSGEGSGDGGEISNEVNAGPQEGLYGTFSYDNSGTTYIVTQMGDSLININKLINITNWKKENFRGF